MVFPYNDYKLKKRICNACLGKKTISIDLKCCPKCNGAGFLINKEKEDMPNDCNLCNSLGCINFYTEICKKCNLKGCKECLNTGFVNKGNIKSIYNNLPYLIPESPKINVFNNYAKNVVLPPPVFNVFPLNNVFIPSYPIPKPTTKSDKKEDNKEINSEDTTNENINKTNNEFNNTKNENESSDIIIENILPNNNKLQDNNPYNNKFEKKKEENNAKDLFQNKNINENLDLIPNMGYSSQMAIKNIFPKVELPKPMVNTIYVNPPFIQPIPLTCTHFVPTFHVIPKPNFIANQNNINMPTPQLNNLNFSMQKIILPQIKTKKIKEILTQVKIQKKKNRNIISIKRSINDH